MTTAPMTTAPMSTAPMSTAPMSTATMMPATTVADRLIEAMVTWDEPTIRSLLADDVWLRALLVRDVIEQHDAAGAIGVLYGWYGSAYETRLVAATSETVLNRVRLTYRVRLRPAWEPWTWHVIEQTGYLRVVDGRITRLELSCTGFHPES